MEKEFGSENIRKNEGEAANYGIFFDDTKYDYMQHLKELGTGGGNSHFVEATPAKGKGKGKSMKLEDALREVSLDDSASQFGGSVYGSEYGGTGYARSTASSYVRKPTYQDQQDIPDAIAGFQPNMDPRLREVLEALDDEAYADDEDGEDVFGELTKNPEEMDQAEWEDTLFDEEDEDGWESDVTEKAYPQKETTDVQSSSAEEKKEQEQEQESTQESSTENKDHPKLPDHDQPVPDMKPEHGEWMREFAKYKKDIKAQKDQKGAAAAAADEASERRTTASTLFTIGGTPVRRKKRKGALTNPSTYSMTSSSLARTEHMRLLDDRFERIEALYKLDEEGEEYDDGASMVSGMTGMTGVSGVSSQAPSLISQGGRRYHDVPLRTDFDEVMDSFLSGWQDRGSQAKRKGAKGKRGRNGNEKIGMQMLDEIRQELGPARIPGKVSGKA